MKFLIAVLASVVLGVVAGAPVVHEDPTMRPTSSPTMLCGGPGSRSDKLPACDDADSSARRLSSHVVHVLSGGQVPRAEVATSLALALDGGEGFEALVEPGEYSPQQHDQLLVLDKDQMEYDIGVVDHPDEPFTIQNAFAHSRPDIMLRVICPAAAEGAMCVVERVDNRALSWFGECALDGERPVATDACLNASYELSLYYISDSHFVLGAAGPGDDCPNVAFFGGREGEGGEGKRRVRYSTAAADVPSHVVGTASLHTILAAEELAFDPSALAFDLATNTCLHYAASISRELNFPEDAALANFIVENLARQGNSEAIAREAIARRLAEGDPALVISDEPLAAGGLLTAALCSLGLALSLVKDCYSAAMAASGLPSDIIKEAVYSQMEL